MSVHKVQATHVAADVLVNTSLSQCEGAPEVVFFLWHAISIPSSVPAVSKKSIPPFSALSFNTKQKELDGKSNTQECRKVKIVKPCKAGRRIDWFKFGGLMRLIRWLQNRRWIWTGIIS